MKKFLMGFAVLALVGCGAEDGASAVQSLFANSEEVAVKSAADIAGDFIAHGEHGTPITLTLDAETGRFHGRVVNNYNGPFSIDGNMITFGPAAATRMMGIPGAMEDEDAYFKFIGAVTEFRLYPDGLALTTANGDRMEFMRK